MLSGKKSKGLVIILSFFVTITANGAPTLSDGNGKLAACSLPPISDVTPFSALEINRYTESCNSYLAGIAVEFLKPPISFTDSAFSSTRVKPLPPIPSALLMVLIGFLCVSFVKDRKFWLAALAGLLWLGHTGFTSLPQLASHLASIKQIEQQHSLNAAYECKLNDSNCLRSDIKETQYIGLLHYLTGIPDGKSTFTNKHSSGTCTLIQHYQKLFTKASGNFHNKIYTSQPAVIIDFCISNPPFNCLALRARQPVCFSPAFTFANIARGPPIPA